MALLRFSVRRWRWTVFTEFNNYDWLQGSNASFMRLYDHTVCGLREAIGRQNFIVGAHGCLMCEDDHTHVSVAAPFASSFEIGRAHV